MISSTGELKGVRGRALWRLWPLTLHRVFEGGRAHHQQSWGCGGAQVLSVSVLGAGAKQSSTARPREEYCLSGVLAPEVSRHCRGESGPHRGPHAVGGGRGECFHF